MSGVHPVQRMFNPVGVEGIAFVAIAVNRALQIRTAPLTEPEQLTQRESKRPFDGFVSNGLLRIIFVRSGIRKRFQVFPYDGYVHASDNH